MPSLWDLMGQYVRDAAPGGVLNPEVTPQGLLDTAALATAPVPVAGDLLGLLADANRMRDPKERTPLNYGLLALGALPLVPSGLGKFGKAVNKVKDYGLDHRPMTIEGGAAPLYDLTRAIPDDVYGPNALQYYGSGDPREARVLKLIRSLRGKPNAKVKIYRGVPDGSNTINPGDWITLDPEVAADYGRVISMEVPASHITAWADSLLEQGYYPPTK